MLLRYFSLNVTILFHAQHAMLRPHAPGGTLHLGIVRSRGGGRCVAGCMTWTCVATITSIVVVTDIVVVTGIPVFGGWWPVPFSWNSPFRRYLSTAPHPPALSAFTHFALQPESIPNFASLPPNLQISSCFWGPHNQICSWGKKTKNMVFKGRGKKNGCAIK